MNDKIYTWKGIKVENLQREELEKAYCYCTDEIERLLTSLQESYRHAFDGYSK